MTEQHIKNIEYKEHKDIDAIELIEARNKEIQYIEEAIKTTNKKSLLFQRIPFYKRRRNRNYDKRKNKKFSYRKKDRHFLRTHTFYAKRFFMLKLQTNVCLFDSSLQGTNDRSTPSISIPLRRRIKSSKYIYKSQDRGFVFDESFRGGFSYDKTEFLTAMTTYFEEIQGDNRDHKGTDLQRKPLDPNNTLIRNDNTRLINSESNYNMIATDTNKEMGLNNSISCVEILPTLEILSLRELTNGINFEKYNEVQHVNNLFEIILTKDKIYLIGGWIKELASFATPLNCIFSIIKKENYDFFELKQFKSLKIFPDNSPYLQSHRIFCDRNEAMLAYQSLSNNSIIPVSLEEIHRLSLENDNITIYDNVNSKIFKIIECSINKDVIDKYNRTPKAKKQNCNLDELYITNGDSKHTYSLFKVIKGSLDRAATIHDDDRCIGRVIRSSYKFSNGVCYGLCAFYDNLNVDIAALIADETILFAKNLGQTNYYEITLVKEIKM